MKKLAVLSLTLFFALSAVQGQTQKTGKEQAKETKKEAKKERAALRKLVKGDQKNYCGGFS